MTMQEMVADLTDNLTLSGVDVAPSTQRIFNMLNRAKDDIVSTIELTDPHLFITRLDYSVSAGSMSETLPTNFVRLIRLTRVDSSSAELAIPVEDVRRVAIDPNWNFETWALALNPNLVAWGAYLEADKIRPLAPSGFPAMTMRLRYRKRVADIAFTDTTGMSASYDEVPAEWHDAIVCQATIDALPATNPNIGKYAARMAKTLDLMQKAVSQRVLDGPISVRMADSRNYGL